MIDALLEALGLGWIFRPHDERPTWRRPHPALRILGTVLWVALVAALLWWADRMNGEIVEFFARLGR